MSDARPPKSDRARARTERRRAQTRAAILDAAEEVFGRQGFHGARVEEIAERADMSVGSIYGYFSGKGGLYLALADRALEIFERYMACIDDPAFGPLARVLAGGDAYLRFHVDHPGLFRFVALRTAGGPDDPADEELEARIRERTAGLLARFAAVIDEAVAAGEATPVDSVRLTTFLWGSWNGVVALGLRPDGLRLGEEEIAATLEVARWLLREGLGSPALRGADGHVGERVPLPQIRPPAGRGLADE